MTRLFATLAALAALVLPAAAQEMRTYTDAAGNTVETPVKPERIVSMRGEQFAAPLFELGAPLVGSSGRIDQGVNNGKPYVRGAYDALGFRFEDNPDVTWIGDPNQPDFEAVAEVGPDLILLPDFREEQYDKLSRIAPTVIVDIWGQTMLERYAEVAEFTGYTGAFERRHARWRERLERAQAVVEDAIGDPAQVSVVLAELRDDTIRAYKVYGSLTQVLDVLGFSKPEIVQEFDGDRIDMSPELIAEIDADFMISTYWAARGTSVSRIEAGWEDHFENWRDLLHATRHNQYFMINREQMRPVTFQSLRSMLDIVVSQIATRDFVPMEN